MNNAETITPQDELPKGSHWIPLQGQEVRELVEHLKLDADSNERIVREAGCTVEVARPNRYLHNAPTAAHASL